MYDIAAKNLQTTYSHIILHRHGECSLIISNEDKIINEFAEDFGKIESPSRTKRSRGRRERDTTQTKET